MNKHGNLQDNRYKVHEVKSLKKMPFPDLARDLLERLVLATQPLMVRQQWRVGQFMEFYPKNGGLLGLNVNAGSRIMIRLRSPQNQQTFLPFESLLGTMVHELVHNAIGEHSFDFYQLVDRLTDEVQRDMHQMRQSGLNPYEVNPPTLPPPPSALSLSLCLSVSLTLSRSDSDSVTSRTR
jgi:hypothetical protein